MIEKATKGITELKYIDFRKIKKREVKVRPNGKTDLTIVDEYIEYYLFNEKEFHNQLLVQVLKCTDTIAFYPSGLVVEISTIWYYHIYTKQLSS